MQLEDSLTEGVLRPHNCDGHVHVMGMKLTDVRSTTDAPFVRRSLTSSDPLRRSLHWDVIPAAAIGGTVWEVDCEEGEGGGARGPGDAQSLQELGKLFAKAAVKQLPLGQVT